ncbi:sigma-E processing peptidase SpoIIGA [Bacillus velezensis]|uniref:sigma-E processing peptidase SpoIIGA n=1 Tax=Bacillus amyloliquefaciens group TaxID=1938374 RepID=UPI00255B607D|nr:sigma-E processing peptidase SpoIIGA [Bacillus amyloliquefaciens]WIX30723.1 sigma-E processing peptidase SpoIIGA [Bacillus amyloliquefaciens]
MKIYLDVIWLLNFCFDSLLLLLTAFILKRQVKKRRVAAGGFIGSAIVLLMFTPVSPFVEHPAGKMAFSVVIVLTAFGFKRFRYFFQNLFAFYFATFLVGGGMIGVHSLLQTESIVQQGVMVTSQTGFGDPISWMFVVIGFPAIWFFSKKRIEDIETKSILYDELVMVQAEFSGQTIRAKGLVDSGNQLYDPLTKTPVMILHIDKFAPILSEKETDLIKSASPLEVIEQLDDSFRHADKLRLIPYRGVGQDNQFLLCLKPDYVTILTKDEMIACEKCLIGISTKPLSADGEFDGIVHPKMLTGKAVKHVS